VTAELGHEQASGQAFFQTGQPPRGRMKSRLDRELAPTHEIVPHGQVYDVDRVDPEVGAAIEESEEKRPAVAAGARDEDEIAF
jgi:hypothetical protein